MPSRIKRSQKSQEASSDSNSSSDEEDASVHSSPEKQKGKSKSKDKEKDMQEEDEENDPSKPYLEEVDENTLRILVSTDNHLGYAERDGVRGNDSFAALEEVLYLAKHYQVDLLLLAGDLFHDNKPSRHTLYKTLQLFRKYCLGSNPVQIQIVGGELEGGGIVNNMFQQGHVNYEDPDYSVDLPVFCIHGNHDDPTRDNTSGQSLSAIDLLDVANLVNYIGKQSQVNQVQVKPVLIQKGTTNLALYGMGSMRDERLNRMWQGNNVTFYQPQVAADDDDDAEGEESELEWFHLFALHQNRDVGRGKKNCINESMIPEWMDCVVWGHEHECQIDLQESVVGTFRITQPGSSVATSLTQGEAAMKQIGVLDIKGTRFRMRPIPLTQVRTFVMGDVSLSSQQALDPDDPKVDLRVAEVLENKVRVLRHDAEQQRTDRIQKAWRRGNVLADPVYVDNPDQWPLQESLNKPEEMLVRIRVEHNGFQALNNQRFGAKFVGTVANPTDILLFHRKKAPTGEGEAPKSRSKKQKNNLTDLPPMEPTELEEINIEDLVSEQFKSSDQNMEIFKTAKLNLALEEYVVKEAAQAIATEVAQTLDEQQRKMIKKLKDEKKEGGSDGDEDMMDDDNEEASDSKSSKRKRRDSDETGKENEFKQEPKSKSKKKATSKRSNQQDSDSEDDFSSRPSQSQKTASSKRGGKAKRQQNVDSDSDFESTRPAKSSRKATSTAKKSLYKDDSSDDEIEVVAPPKKTSRKAASTKRRKKTQDSSDEDEDVVDMLDSDSEEEAPKKARGRTKKASSQSKFSQSSLSFATPSAKRSRRATSTKKKYTEESSDDDGLDDDWGTAQTDTFRSG